MIHNRGQYHHYLIELEEFNKEIIENKQTFHLNPVLFILNIRINKGSLSFYECFNHILSG